MLHRHHIIPKHEWKRRFGSLDGVDDSDNVVHLSVDQHADATKEKLGLAQLGKKLNPITRKFERNAMDKENMKCPSTM